MSNATKKARWLDRKSHQLESKLQEVEQLLESATEDARELHDHAPTGEDEKALELWQQTLEAKTQTFRAVLKARQLNYRLHNCEDHARMIELPEEPGLWQEACARCGETLGEPLPAAE